MNIDKFLEQKPVNNEQPESEKQTKLTKEQFADLTNQINQLKKRIEKGEIVTVKEAALITVWFRARRVENFTVVTTKAKPKVGASGIKPKRRLKSEERQDLGNALINSL